MEESFEQHTACIETAFRHGYNDDKTIEVFHVIKCRGGDAIIYLIQLTNTGKAGYYGTKQQKVTVTDTGERRVVKWKYF